MRRLWRATLHLTVLCLAATGLTIASPGSAGAEGPICTGGTYADAEKAKENFQNDCGQPFRNTTDYRCDWVPGGFECTGPGSSSGDTAPATDARPDAPELHNIVVNKRGVAELKFEAIPGAAGYNIYRNDSYVGTSKIARYTDEATAGTHTYYVVAFNSSNEFSSKSNELEVNTRHLAYVTSLAPVQVSGRWQDTNGRNTVLFRDVNNDDVKIYNLFRNGEYWTSIRPDSRSFTDHDPGKTVLYEIQAVRNSGNGDEYGPKRAVIAPNYANRARNATFQGNSSITNTSANSANTAAAEAQAARAEADAEFDEFVDALVPDVSLVGTVGTGGVGLDLEADLNVNNAVREGLEWLDADERADALEERAQRAAEDHEACLAGSSDCPVGVIQRPSDDEGGDGPELNSPANNFGWGNRPCGEFC